MTRQHQPSREWDHGLMDCCSPCDSCLLSTFLPCILYGRTADRLENSGGQVNSMNGDCMLFGFIAMFTGCGWILNTMKRGEIRERLGIEGSGCGDCCASFWCLCCALVQQDKEANKYLTHADPVNEGYQMQSSMQMPGPYENHPKGPPPSY